MSRAARTARRTRRRLLAGLGLWLAGVAQAQPWAPGATI
jgi:hypothetical protein